MSQQVLKTDGGVVTLCLAFLSPLAWPTGLNDRKMKTKTRTGMISIACLRAGIVSMKITAWALRFSKTAGQGGLNLPLPSSPSREGSYSMLKSSRINSCCIPWRIRGTATCSQNWRRQHASLARTESFCTFPSGVHASLYVCSLCNAAMFCQDLDAIVHLGAQAKSCVLARCCWVWQVVCVLGFARVSPGLASVSCFRVHVV